MAPTITRRITAPSLRRPCAGPAPSLHRPCTRPRAGCEDAPMRITALAGGIGGARFLRGLLRHLDRAAIAADVTVVGNTADDVTMHGLRVCPDLDTVMYTLGGGIHEEQGWGRSDERFTVAEELAAYGAGP